MNPTAKALAVPLVVLLAISFPAQAQSASGMWKRLKTAVAAEMQQVARPAAGQDDLSRLREIYGDSIKATRLPGIYVARTDDAMRAAANLITGDGKVVMNVESLGMSRGIGGKPLTETEQEQVIRPLLPYFGAGEFIQFGPPAAPLRMVLLSAMDCSYCAKLEPAMASRKLRYAVIPGAIISENNPRVRRIYCAPDRSKAWLQALVQARLPASSNSDCAYDEEHFWVLSGLLGGSTPRLLFADGDLMRPGIGDASIAQIQAKLSQLERDGIQF